jgi:hypothetical protein
LVSTIKKLIYDADDVVTILFMHAIKSVLHVVTGGAKKWYAIPGKIKRSMGFA